MATITFPTTQTELHDYLVRVWTYLNTAAVQARLLITASNMGIFNTLYSHPNAIGVTDPTNLGYIELYPLHIDKTTSNTIITALYHKKVSQKAITDPIGIKNQLRVIAADFVTSLLTDTDRSTLSLNAAAKKAATTHRVATQNQVNFKDVGIGGGDVLMKCYPSGTKTLNPSAATQRAKAKSPRPHKEAGYQIRSFWIILKQGVAAPINEKVAGITITVETKAQLVRHLGSENVGNVLWEFKQWHDPKHTDLDGPISAAQSCIIT